MNQQLGKYKTTLGIRVSKRSRSYILQESSFNGTVLPRYAFFCILSCAILLSNQGSLIIAYKVHYIFWDLYLRGKKVEYTDFLGQGISAYHVAVWQLKRYGRPTYFNPEFILAHIEEKP